MTTEPLNPQVPIVDENGFPTVYFQQLMRNLIEQANKTETTVEDHETRITALEP